MLPPEQACCLKKSMPVPALGLSVFFSFTVNLMNPQSACSSSSSTSCSFTQNSCDVFEQPRKSVYFSSPQLDHRRKISEIRNPEFVLAELRSGANFESCPSLIDPPPAGQTGSETGLLVPSVNFPFQFNFGSTLASSITVFFDN